MKVSRFFEVRWVGPALVLVLVLVGAAVMQAFDANPAVSQSQQLVAGAAATDPGTDPSDSAWAGVSKVQVALNAQPGIYASGGGSIAELTAQALHYRGELFVRLEWADTTNDRTTVLPTDYSDAIAIEFPAKAASSVPSVCMGQADQGVNIWQWRADSQRGVDTIQAAFPNGYADWYPDESEDVWFPARAVENPFAETDGKAVQDLVARLFGTISPAATQTVDAQGSWGNGRWAVVFSRPFESPGIDQAEFDVDTDTDIAFAVWNGSEGDRDGIKSTSQFLKLNMEPVPDLPDVPGPPATGEGVDATESTSRADSKWLWLAAGLLAISLVTSAVIAAVASRESS